ncbi:type II CRISPR RNA-guided endonuclease Cas9 [Sneathia sanguinegens]|uniref:type II CRISPR RNA-guided endonuclease Cas9 n=1 Tax=Sneathia sanguinegens TaxID=40543 RepID=UPI00288B1643|nr:type II CRISPR RNA-guided endonuclease Cas9 [Sneathia sanguinegens]
MIKNKREYYLGLDLGTSSVGWAVTDEEYNLLRFNKKDMWGSRLFDEAKTAKERRIFRANRRRLERRARRLELLSEIFEEEIKKVDENFFRRLYESNLHKEDKSIDFEYPLFNDENYTDKDYHKEFPTIYHLRNDLCKENKKFDIRLIYLAIHHILKNRGHFIFEGQKFSDIKNFENLFKETSEFLEKYGVSTEDIDVKELEEVICNNKSKTEKKNNIKNILKKNLNKEFLEVFLTCSIGSKVSLNKVLGIEEELKIELSKVIYEDKRSEYEAILGDDIELIDYCKKIYDFIILKNILKDSENISEFKVRQYEIHKEELKNLKYLFRKYLTKKDYFNFFTSRNEKGNYATYVNSTMYHGNKNVKEKMCTIEDFNKEIKKYIKKMKDNIEDSDKNIFDDINKKLEENKFLDKLRIRDNGVLPYQVNETELRKILENQGQFYQFLLNKTNGKEYDILKLLTFRIPYYVGTTKGKFSWLSEEDIKNKEKITPWNFNEKIDIENAGMKFISHMTNKCSYLKSEDVLPKQSLIYQEYILLNELNKIRVDRKYLSLQLKNEIVNELFKKVQKVTLNKFKSFLLKKQAIIDKDSIEGIDNEFNSTLSSYVKLYRIMNDKLETNEGENFVERLIYLKTIYGKTTKFILKVLRQEFKEYIEKNIGEEKLNKIVKIEFDGWGRLSRKLLLNISFEDIRDGKKQRFENILEALRTTNYNFMELMSNKFNLIEKIEEFNKKDNNSEKFNIYDYVNELYVSPSIKRPIIQAYKLAMEIKKINCADPKKVFIEMARGGGEKGKKTEKRNAKIKKYYEEFKKDENYKLIIEKLNEELQKYNDNRLRQKKLFLYFMQLGKSMYTGEKIDLDELLNSNKYDIDHIIPQSKIKDDSFNNIVLVEKEINSHKNDSDFIDESIRNRMKGFWYVLLTKEMITKEKYNRLMRNTLFSTEELSGFVARQLVETRQSTLEIKKLFESIFPNTEIICVKAGLVSDFREQFEIIKVRELNDTHHAQDAYLNIVVGNVYDAKFTKDFGKFIQRKQRGEINESLNLKKTFDDDVYQKSKQESKQVWNKETDKNKVKTMCERKTINVTKMLCEDKGQLFNLTIEKKCKKDNMVPNTPKALKGININPSEIAEKYGYYSSLNAAYYVIFKYTKISKKKSEEILEFEPVYIYENNKKLTDSDIIKKLENLGYNNPILVTRIKKNQKILLNGYPYRISGGTSKGFEIKNDYDLYLDREYLKYAKDLSNFCKDNEKNENVRYFVRFKKKKNIDEKNETYDECILRLNYEFNKLFEYLCIEKPNLNLYKKYINISKIIGLNDYYEDFKTLDLNKKSKFLKNLLNIYNRSTIAKMNDFKLSNELGRLRLKIFSYNAKIIQESITGLITNEMEIK